ncbi:MAG: MBL fold metallo-hydrolase [Candidatus Bipolaricaulota bacterium]
MRVTIVYDNTTYKGGLNSDWGFAGVVEYGRRKILFDTGANGSILLSNMRDLGIEPKEIDEVFISHNHHDHTGGLPLFLGENSNVKIWAPPSFRPPVRVEGAETLVGPAKLHKGVYTTGELEGIEQSLCLETERGIVVIAGCSHPSMRNILDTASKFGELYGIIGGLHATKPSSLDRLKFICATHCTKRKSEIKSMYPDRYVQGGAGREIEIP